MKFAIIITGLFGLSFILLPDFTEQLFNILLDNPTGEGYIRFIYGVLGAVLVGWSATFFMIVQKGGQQSMIIIPLMIWFVIDTTFSLISGYAGNALLNLGFVVLYAVPLMRAKIKNLSDTRSKQTQFYGDNQQ